jgi:hypothetical protein
MHENGHKPVDRNLLEEMGYETRDVDPSGLPKGAVGFFAVLAVLAVLAWLFTGSIAPDMVRAPDLAKLERKNMPPKDAPLLQSGRSAVQDMRDLRAAEGRRLTTYGWSDRATGHAHVPIDVAMKKVLERGLPTRPGARAPEGEE